MHAINALCSNRDVDTIEANILLAACSVFLHAASIHRLRGSGNERRWPLSNRLLLAFRLAFLLLFARFRLLFGELLTIDILKASSNMQTIEKHSQKQITTHHNRNIFCLNVENAIDLMQLRFGLAYIDGAIEFSRALVMNLFGDRLSKEIQIFRVGLFRNCRLPVVQKYKKLFREDFDIILKKNKQLLGTLSNVAMEKAAWFSATYFEHIRIPANEILAHSLKHVFRRRHFIGVNDEHF